MHASPSRLPEKSRKKVAEGLQRTLVDALDLHAQVKVAHWNVKGPHFMSYHEMFEKLAGAVAEHADAIAERAVTLGAVVQGSARHVAKSSRLGEPEGQKVQGLELVAQTAELLEAFLDGARAAREVSEKEGDADTEDLLTGAIADLEKYGWFLRATLG